MMRELANGRCKLMVAKNVCAFIEHDRSVAEESR